MTEFLKMDIFFFVTTIVVLALGVLLTFILWRIERVLKHVEHISEQAALESDAIRQDLAEMRGEIHRGKGRLKSLFGFFKKSAGRVSKDT
jgi:hypothetical protein